MKKIFASFLLVGLSVIKEFNEPLPLNEIVEARISKARELEKVKLEKHVKIEELSEESLAAFGLRP